MKARIVIEVELNEAGDAIVPQGNVVFEAPLHSKQLCYEMIAVGMEAVRKYQGPQNAILRPEFGFPTIPFPPKT